MPDLNLNVKIRGLKKETLHPAELGRILIENADRIKCGVVLIDYEDEDGQPKTRESYCGPWTTKDLSWWITCLQDTIFKNLRD